MSAVRPVLICFAGDVWNGNPHSRHHLARRLRHDFDVLFVEGIPMRAAASGDRHEVLRIARKLRRARRALTTVEPGLHILRPRAVPPAGPLGRRAQLAEVRHAVERACRVLGLDGPRISWFSLPNVAPLRGRLGERASVFFYQDRYDAFQHVDAARLRIHVAALATGCELTIATASGLADDLRNLGATPLLVPHGVEVERFAGDHPVPQELREAERPLVGHVGLLDDYIALEAIREVAESLDSGTVVLVGGANVDVAQLQHPRVRILGRVPYEKIPGYLSAFDVCLAPFRVNRLTIAVNPIKLREYLAAGRPVVATDLPEMRPYADVVELVADPSDFPAAVQRVLHRGDDADAVARRRARVADASWDAIADRIGALLQSLL